MDRALFVHAYAKKDKANIEAEELRGYRTLAAFMLGYSQGELDSAVHSGTLIEVKCDGAKVS